METPEIHVLNRINWQFFGTLTFKSERLPERVRLTIVDSTVTKCALVPLNVQAGGLPVGEGK